MDATISAIEGITGLKINYWAMVNLEGFRGLVDAVGGVTLNVRQPIPVGGLGADVTGYIKPGVRKLNGMDTLWFARSRDSSDDYSRMARQKCVMNAMLHQVSPQTVLTNFEKIAKASSAMISTDIPASEVDRFMALALKAKGQPIATLSLVPPLINTGDPDIGLIHRKVAAGARGVAASRSRTTTARRRPRRSPVARSAPCRTGTPRTTRPTSARSAELAPWSWCSRDRCSSGAGPRRTTSSTCPRTRPSSYGRPRLRSPTAGG